MTLTFCCVFLTLLCAALLGLGITGWRVDPQHRVFAVSLMLVGVIGAVCTGNLMAHATGRVTYEEHVAADGSRSWVRVRVTPATPVERSEP